MSRYHFGEVATNSCPTDDVSEANCLEAVHELLPDGVVQGRTSLVAGSWGWVPPGCSVQSDFTHGRSGDWAAHYNRNLNGRNDGGYTPVCKESQDSPTHYLTVVSWPVWAWGEWDLESKGPIEKCVHRDQIADADGSGDFFTSCCTAEGAGMRRDCGTTRNTDFQTAADQCESQGGQLCTADEVVAVENGRGRRTTVTQGCSVDGPRTASGADLNRLWTSTPCSP